MRARLIAVSAVAGLTVAAFPAHATTAAPTPRPLVNTDPSGDANFVNGQGGFLPVPSRSTPVDETAADITAVTLQNTYVTKKVKKKVVKTLTGFTMTMTLAAAPDQFTYYNVSATIPSCTTGAVQFAFATTPNVGTAGAGCTNGVNINAINGVTANASGNKITWTVPLSVAKSGAVISNLSAFTFPNTPVLLIQSIDDAVWSSSFTVGK